MFPSTETINDYSVYHELGRGGFATVHKAIRIYDKLEVACKMIDRLKIQQQTTTQHRLMHKRLKNEIEIHSRLKHPNIVDLFNYFEDQKYVYLILELCQYGDLEKYLKIKRTLNENETRVYVKQVIEGLQYLHDHGILHRDIKLQNLLLTENYNIKIADFGLAKKVETIDEKNHTMCGTPNFLSPEIATRSSHSFETDVWSLGILIYTLLVGHPPFDTESVLSTLSRVAKVEYELPSSLSDEAKDLINNILQKQPEKRLTLNQVKEHSFFTKEFEKQSPLYENLFLTTKPPDILFTTAMGTSSSSKSDYFQNNPTSNLYTSTLPRQENRLFQDRLTTLKLHENFMTPSQPIKARRSPSLDILRTGTTDTTRPDSASVSSSRDSGLPKSSLDYSSNLSISRSLVHEQDSSINKNNHHKQLQKLNSQRLKPIRQIARLIMFAILENGEVVVETLRVKGKKKRIVDVCRISTDGNKIITYIPTNHSSTGTYPSPIPKDRNSYQEYDFDNLPEIHWKQYQRAYKFVNVIRSRTAKIQLITPDAKCQLMETSVDFEINFLCGIRILIYRDDSNIDDHLKIKLTNESDNSTIILDYEKATKSGLGEQFTTPELQNILENSCQYYDYCLSKDHLLENDQQLFPDIQTFPVLFNAQLGKKLNQENQNRPNSSCSLGRSRSQQFGSSSTVHEIDHFSTSSSTRRAFAASDTDIRPSSQNLSPKRSYIHYNPIKTDSVEQLTVLSTYPSSTLNSNLTGINNLTCKSKNVRDIGCVRQQTNGDFEIQFNDNSLMKINANVEQQLYIDSNGKHYYFDRFGEKELPECVKHKLFLIQKYELFETLNK